MRAPPTPSTAHCQAAVCAGSIHSRQLVKTTASMNSSLAPVTVRICGQRSVQRGEQARETPPPPGGGVLAAHWRRSAAVRRSGCRLRAAAAALACRCAAEKVQAACCGVAWFVGAGLWVHVLWVLAGCH